MTASAQREPAPGPTEVSGRIAAFTFRNQDSGFAVVRLAPEGGGPALCAVGALAQLTEGQQVKLSGRYVEHPRFGRQLEVDVAEAVLPGSVEGIRAYLSSNLVKGVGPSIAERITDVFGDDTLQVIAEHPERLREVRGLGKKRIDELVQAVRAHRDVQAVMVFLRAHGLGPALATRIVERYGRGASALIQANPYRLVDDVIGVGFRTADDLAGRLGIARDAPERVRAGVLHALAVAARDGHCFLTEVELCDAARALIGCPPEAVRAELRPLVAEAKVVVEKSPDAGAPRVYPFSLHAAEVGIAARVDDLVRHPGAPLPVGADDALTWFRRRTDMTLPDGQAEALRRALEHPVSVITGGPGVGKTTIIRALTEVLLDGAREVLLAAPTGRAAKRLEESTGHAASTIHRLLEFQPGVNRFLRDDRDPLRGDLLVVDEASMLDAPLAYNLLRAVPRGMKVVLVGDANQLPAVGPGNVLGDVIDSGRAPVTALTEIFRQQRGSRIVQSAHGILRGEIPRGGGDGSDFYFIETRSAAHARNVVRELVTSRIPSAFAMDPFRDVQVLCPMYRGDAGADAINRELQGLLNPGADEVERGGRRYRRGDKVMQIRNDYALDVFNGDAGRIVHIDKGASELRVRFGDRVVPYKLGDLDQLVPAYAISIHRSQGSEFPAVVMPLVTEHYVMLRRSLLYTGITRGKRLVVLVGSSRALELAVRQCDESRRHSGLGERLRAAGDGANAS